MVDDSSHSATMHTTQNSALLRLAAELRNNIYELVVLEPDVIDIGTKVKLPALFAVSRQVRKEAEGVYFGMNTWGTIVEAGDFRVVDWAAKLTHRQRQHVMKLNITVQPTAGVMMLNENFACALLEDGDRNKAAVWSGRAKEREMMELTELNIWAWFLFSLGIKVGALCIEAHPGRSCATLIDEEEPDNVEVGDMMDALEADFSRLAKGSLESVMYVILERRRGDWGWPIEVLENAGRSVGGVRAFASNDEKAEMIRASASEGVRPIVMRAVGSLDPAQGV